MLKKRRHPLQLPWVVESNISISGLTVNKISDHFSISTADMDFDLAADMNPFPAVA